MVVREEADSGLRAGFITEEEALRQKLEQEKALPVEEVLEETPKEDEKTEEKPKAKDPALNLESLSGPGSTVEMKGISGKNITGVIKVVKKNKNEKDDSSDDKKEKTSKKDKDSTEQKKIADKDKKENKEQAPKATEKQYPAKVKSGKATSSEVDKKTSKKDKAATPKKVAKAQPKKEAAKKQEKPAAKKVETKVTEKEKTSSPSADKNKISEHKAVKANEEKTQPKAKEVAPKAKKAEAKSTSGKKQKTEAKKKPADKEVKAGTKQEIVKKDKKAEAKKEKEKKTSEHKAKAPAKKTPAKKAPKKKVSPKKSEAESSEQEFFEEAARIAELSRPLTQQDEPVEVKTPKPPKAVKPKIKKKKRIRPQQGNYIGEDADKPAAERRKARRKRQREDKRRDRAKQERSRRQAAPAAEFVEKDHQRSSYNQRHRQQQRREQLRAERQLEEQRERREMLERERKQRREAKAEKERKVAKVQKVTLPASMTVKELAESLKKTTADVIMKLMEMGVMATINQEVDFETAAIIANEFGIEAEQKVEITEEDILFDDSPDDEDKLVPRPPVVVVMGHVDHGKTSILDYVRNTSVTADEAGGITQHIGAYTISLHGKKITFLDTPGHEAFTVMRARGASVTDIAVLVVAADDGVMPQTVEAINHARAANTEIIVAINKIDRPQANIERVKMQLAQYNLMDAEWGGTTSIVPVSAKTGENMDDLLETILITAEIMELRADPTRQAKGTVIEAELDTGRGPVATVLIQRGTLHTGDAIVVGSNMGHVRMMYSDRGEQISEAGPSTPVEIIGLSEVPEGGDILYQVENEKVARDLAERRREEEREAKLRQSSHMSLESLFDKMSEEEKIDLNVIVKADVGGSVEAVKQSLEGLSTDQITVNVIHGGTGGINESDIRLAEVSDAIIIGFNVRPSAVARDIAESSNVDIRLYSVIYEMIDEVEQAMKGMLDPEIREVVTGNAEVRETFKISSIGTVAGSYMTSGTVHRNDQARVVRDGIVIYEGDIASLKRYKDDVREVAQGYEFGISIDKFNDIKVGDEFEFFTMEEIDSDGK